MPIATQSGGCSRFCTVLPPNRRVPKLHATRVNDRGSQPKKSGNQIVNNMMLEHVRFQSLAAGQPTLLQNLLLRFWTRSEEHTSELQSLMRISYAVFCLKKKTNLKTHLAFSIPTMR